MSDTKKTYLLCVLDGFGHRDPAPDNAITPETAPVYHALLKACPHSLLRTDGEAVGLPEGQMGNSEVGHMTLGAGRIVYQDLPKISRAIARGEIAGKPEMKDFIEKLRRSGGTCHLMGLASPGGVHAHEDHIIALAEIVSKSGVPVIVHLLLDGRDTPPQSALSTLPSVVKRMAALSNVRIGSLCGRYHAMDRDKRWERIEKAYLLFTEGKGQSQPDVVTALQDSYRAGRDDEFVEPVVLPDFRAMKDGDGLLMANFRADRARQILTAFLDPDFTGFQHSKIVRFAAAMGMVEYSSELNRFLPALFPPKTLEKTFGEILAERGMTQLRLAETEKYAHVTYFFNGGNEAVFPGETRLMVPSPKVATYDLQPEMSAAEVTEKAIAAIRSKNYDFILMNYANGDMVGHTGDLAAAKTAVAVLDKALDSLVKAIRDTGGVMLVTADHGNCEEMHDETTDGAHTAHTLNPVPFVLVNAPSVQGLENGGLADVAPTLLALMGINQPPQMEGKSLLVRQ